MSETLHDAIQRAQRHFRGAAREGLAAVEALFEAAVLTGGLAGETSQQLRSDLEEALADWRRALENDATFRIPETAAAPLRALLKNEIERWEIRSERDASVRPVLRGLLALREILWDFGLQGREASAESPASEAAANVTAPRSTATPSNSTAAPAGATSETDVDSSAKIGSTPPSKSDSLAWASIEDDPGWDDGASEPRRGPWAGPNQSRPAS